MTTVNNVQGAHISPWRRCGLCLVDFKSSKDFCRHLRQSHCTKEGGSYVCRYGANNICPSLPLEGVSDMDYENHITRDHAGKHLHAHGRNRSLEHNEASPPPSATDNAPSVVQDQLRWTVYNATVNLPAALNDPNRTKRETDFFTKTWGQDFYEHSHIPKSTYIPDISRKYFEKYKNRISKRYKKYIRSTSNSDSVSGETYLHQLEKSRSELQEIPKLYLLQNFDLEHTDTFNSVFPWSMIEDSKKSSPGHQSSKLLQEKLSHYLDIIEVHIARQISTKSDAFFQAMSSHDKLQEDMMKTCQSIKQLRHKVQQIDEVLAKGSLKVIKLQQARWNHINLYEKLKMMATVHQTQPTIQLLLSTNEFVGALDLISTTQEVLSQELPGVHSFRHLGSQLAEMENLIEKMLQEDFAKCISSDLNRPVTDTIPLLEEEKLVSLVFGMIRKDKFNFVDMYREEAFTAIRACVKQTVVEAVSEADNVETSDDNVTSLGDQMRMLDYKQWMELLCKIFSNLLILLKRGQTFQGVIGDVIGITAGRTKAPSPVSTPTEDKECTLEEPSHLHVSVSEDAADMLISDDDYSRVQSSLCDMMYAICDHAHDRCVKVIVARSKDGFLERLSSTEFVQLSRTVENFVTDCEFTCGRRSTSLRLSLQSQATKFVNRFHEERRQKLSLILDNERWKQADVPAEFQELVDHITKSGTICIPERTQDKDKKPSESLKVEEQNFTVVGTVLLLLKMMVEYCQCVDDIPSAAPDLLTRLVDLLKIFNSRTCQLVLGAGALQLVGLKTISTRNLALASRCLQLIVYFMPKVRQHFEDRLISKNKTMLKHLDQANKDYNDHINEITNKLVSVMESVIQAQLVRWEVKAPMPSQCFRAICKQISKMHEAVIDILPLNQIQDLFSRINSSFKDLLRQQLLKLEVTNNGGPQYGLVTSDVAFYSGTYKTLRGLEHLCNNMSDLWNGL
ncbi:vacuolar protein sorting-associated protein 54 [Mytilus galloprovincialis]|uniref:Vacuolar protein sorting-associated protein 54 n=1 Tax=Mytilus galloprovincialis TaxID=29158 RepID=A0A8B6DPR9_MYTGA|nr:vacuolar protein sorting-associated protein 54 [Mytilus galloprovincialis]